jgi:HAD superfamily hydrolase (TIGR01484 family)
MSAGLGGGLLVFSDLDGCLLDERTYRWDAARPALEALGSRGVPLLLCSSKTRAEMEALAGGLGLAWPFIVENGGALVIPNGGATGTAQFEATRQREAVTVAAIRKVHWSGRRIPPDWRRSSGTCSWPACRA